MNAPPPTVETWRRLAGVASIVATVAEAAGASGALARRFDPDAFALAYAVGATAGDSLARWRSAIAADDGASLAMAADGWRDAANLWRVASSAAALLCEAADERNAADVAAAAETLRATCWRLASLCHAQADAGAGRSRRP